MKKVIISIEDNISTSIALHYVDEFKRFDNKIKKTATCFKYNNKEAIMNTSEGIIRITKKRVRNENVLSYKVEKFF